MSRQPIESRAQVSPKVHTFIIALATQTYVGLALLAGTLVAPRMTGLPEWARIVVIVLIIWAVIPALFLVAVVAIRMRNVRWRSLLGWAGVASLMGPFAVFLGLAMLRKNAERRP